MRTRRLEELTDTQLRFLYEAQYERKQAEMGGGDDVSTNSAPTQPSSSVTTPTPGGPPVRGETRRY